MTLSTVILRISTDTLTTTTAGIAITKTAFLNPYLIFKVNSYCQPGITMIIEKTNT